MAEGPRVLARPIEERAFHAWLARTLPAGRTGALPLGDDAAALSPPPGRVVVATTDSLVEGTHFLRRSPARSIGGAATGVSLSDLASKGATPVGVLLAVIVPPSTPRRWAEEVAVGAETAAQRFGAHLVGGDTKAGPTRTVVSTAIGWGRAGHLAPRTGARPGDLLVTTGTVGRGGIAYCRGIPPARARPSHLRALLDVRPRVREGTVLARWAHAMLDTSDGLGASCRLLAEASQVRILVDERRLPYAPGRWRATLSEEDRRVVAFFGGDYELLAALPPRRFAVAARAVRRVGGRLTSIGSVGAGRGAVLSTASGRIPMPEAGWDPFRTPTPRSRRAVGRSRRVHVTLK